MYRAYCHLIVKQPAAAGSVLTHPVAITEASDRTNVNVGAYCLLQTGSHIVVSTADLKQAGNQVSYSARIPKTYSSGWAYPTLNLIN